LRVVHAIQFRLFAGMYLVGFPARRYFAFSANDCDARAVSIFIYVNAERSRFLHRKREVRRIYLIQITLAHFPHAEINRALRNARLQDVFVQVQERQCGHAPQMQRSLPGLQFRSRILIRPQFIANRHRPIFRSGSPVFCSRRLKRHVSIQIADARNARWWIAFFGARLGRYK
jgi:hypothetical protein